MAFPQFLQPHTVIAPGAASREAASAGARAEAAAAGRPQSGKLVFSIQKQLQTQWCWAAVSTSVSLYFNRSSTWTQCTVANKNLKRSDCCGSPSNCNTPSVLVAADPDESQYLYISDPIYLDSRVALDFAALVLAKLTNDAVSFRFLLFCLVGLTGIAIHMAVLQVAVSLGTRFGWAQTIATFAAITWNFVLNNMFTYRDQRLAGWQFVTGLVRFQVICAVGAISNVGIATAIYRYDPQWWVAGLGGALMGAVWNYVVSAAFVWRQR